MTDHQINRRTFVEQGVTAGAGLALASIAGSHAAAEQAKEQVKGGEAKRIKVAVIGCGSVSGSYLPNMVKCPYVELVSACDS
jgi:hypothetical protein